MLGDSLTSEHLRRFNTIGANVEPFLSSDDKVEESKLSNSFDITCRAWKARFGVQYTHCGCPIPGETIGQKLSRLVMKSRSESHLFPPRADLRAATHPSDHNAVLALHHKSSEQTRRREKIAKRTQRDGGRTVRTHDPAFLTPVPLQYPSAGCAAPRGSVVQGGCAPVRTMHTLGIVCPYAGR